MKAKAAAKKMTMAKGEMRRKKISRRESGEESNGESEEEVMKVMANIIVNIQ